MNGHDEGCGCRTAYAADAAVALRRPCFLRPAGVDQLTGYASKTRSVLGWEPGLSSEQIIHRIVDADLVLQPR